MVPLTSLWMPILLSAVLVFVASSILHMVLPYHHSDYKTLPSEAEIMEALRRFKIPPGDYMMPCAGNPATTGTPAFLEKMNKGPVAVMTVMKSGPPSMSTNLIQWFIFCLIVSVIAAYVAGRALGPGADYLEVFRFAGCVAFVGYALALWEMSIWYQRSWLTTTKSTIDGLVYGLLTAGTLGWLWPR